MFIIDATFDFSDAVARLARLMYNLERGEKVYDWTLGSRSEPDPQPGPNILTISIPGVTTSSPPTKVDYCPAVGFIYYVPSTPFNLQTLVAELAMLLDYFPHEHLIGPLPVETTAHGTLYHSGRIYSTTSVVQDPDDALPGKWDPSQLYPTRYFVTHAITPLTPPRHLSYWGAFTWHIMPITVAVKIQKFSTFADVNAIVSAIYFDTFTGGLESLTPVMSIALNLFNIPPLPTMLTQLKKRMNLRKTILIFISNPGENTGTFDLAGSVSDYQILDIWRPPVCKLGVKDLPHPTNLDMPGLSSVCAECSVPLWGDVFAVPNKTLPGYVALCLWCCGCAPPHPPLPICIATGWTRAQAFQDTRWECLLPLLDVPVTKIKVKRRWVGYIATFPNEQRVIFEVCNCKDAERCSKSLAPACLQYPKLRDIRLPSYGWCGGIGVRTPWCAPSAR